MELYNGNGIGKIMSGVGKPLLMDNMTKQSCLKKLGKLDFARVLVEVSTDDDLPSSLEISYPPIGNRPTKAENGRGNCSEKLEEFTVVGKKNRPASSLMNLGQVRGGGQSNRGGRVQMNSRQGYSNKRRRNGGFVQRSQYQQRGNSNVGNDNKNGKVGVMNRSVSKLSVNDPSKGSLVDKPTLASTYSQNFRPRVLVRGSGSANVDTSSFRKDVPVKNSFQLLDDQMMKDKEECVLESMDEEYKSDIWPKLKQDITDVMESGYYRSVTVRMDWSLAQEDFFYKKFLKYGMDPNVEDDDVATEDGGMASDMRDDDVELVARSIDNRGLLRLRMYPMFKAFSWNVRGLNNDPNRKQVIDLLREGIIMGWDPNSVRVMVLSQSTQLMNLFVETVDGHYSFYCSFIYAHVRTSGRKVLWKDLICHSLMVKEEPWLLMGDFNVILDPSESLGRTDGVLKKLDRVMCNGYFVEEFVNSNALFLPFVASDHTPAVVVIPGMSKAKPRSFKFANFLASKAEFLPIVKKVWEYNIPGHAMFSVVSKLKLFKKPLRKLKYAQGDLAKKVSDTRHELERIQTLMVNDSHNSVLREKEMAYLKEYKDAMKDEELMLKQRAKVEWLSEGDSNTKLGSVCEALPKCSGDSRKVEPIVDPDSLFCKRLSHEDSEFMVRLVTNEEIKAVIFAMNDDKASGPDGFSSKIFKTSWPIIGNEVCVAIRDLFKNDRLLKEVNATIIAFVPKSQTPRKVFDFRPISCCNVLYKVITKIIANRIKGCLGKIIDECQNAFIPSRQITDNELLTHELMRNYHRNCEPSKVAFKIDIHNAYDSVDYFKGMRGLRQGDPLSPYLFTLVMEVFSLMVRRKIVEDRDFKYHWRCDRLKLTHLSFVDDLMVFSKANVHSVRVLSSDLKEFSGVYGLVPNLDKSLIFFGNVPESLKFAILNILPLAVGVFPVSSIHVYWASMFILPKAVNSEIEQLMRGFLWSHGDLCKGHAKVRWKDVCYLKFQGGLGLSLGEVDCKVCDIVDRGEWLWPESWRNKFPFLFQLPPPLLFRDRKVKVLWKSNNGKVGDFSTKPYSKPQP
ncbi:RNA-directed DNA polymerase, eukaryota, reverse transcriptase zinc-binding domain protein [Tanacetum coccineum]